MRVTLLAAALTLPLSLSAPVYAAGSGNETAPKPTETSEDCKGVRVWDEEKQRCVKPKESRLDDDQLYQAVRELAYAGRYEDAQGVLDAMSDQSDDRVLTYRGFTARKLGQMDVAQGDRVAALTQLREINARGGADTWAATSLRTAIETGVTYNY